MSAQSPFHLLISHWKNTQNQQFVIGNLLTGANSGKVFSKSEGDSQNEGSNSHSCIWTVV